MNRIRSWITTIVLIFGMLPWFAYGQATQPREPPAARDSIAVRLPLSHELDGIDGYLLLTQDARLTLKLAERLWGIGDVDIDDDPKLKTFKDEPLRNAMIQIVDHAGQVVDSKDLEAPLARLQSAQLHGNSSLTYLLTVDYSAGFGSYSGPITNLVEIKSGRFQWVEAKNTQTGKSAPIRLMTSLKTTWKFVDAADGRGKQILLAQCRSDWSSAKADPDFRITYARFYFDGTKWLLTERTVKGFSEFDEGFPSRKHFP